MTRSRVLAALALVVASVASSSSQVPADLPRNQPGFPTVGRVRIVNAARDEAVPVVVRGDSEAVPVTVLSLPPLTLPPASVVATRAARQAWEYRQLVVAGGEDVATVLNEAGREGWEAIAATAQDGRSSVWTLKRPR